MRSWPVWFFAACFLVCRPLQAAAPLHKMAVIDVEIEGDLSDSSRQTTWPFRLEALTNHLRDGIAAEGTYEIVSLAPAAEVLERNKGRRAIHICPPCLRDIADAVGADRILAARVFRQSNLLMYLQMRIIDGTSGETLITRNFTFRGDNDQSWLRSAEFLIEDLRDVPEDKR